MDDFAAVSARAGLACHDLVGWLMWDPAAISAYERLGVANGAGWIVNWRLAPLGDIAPEAAAATTFSIDAAVIAMVMNMARGHADAAGVSGVVAEAVPTGLEAIAPGLGAQIAPLATDLWRGVDSVHAGARPLFAAHRALPRPDDAASPLSAWLAANCLRELRGDNHWLLCASEDLDAVEVGLLHSALVDVVEYGSEEWIARSRGNDDAAIAAGWARLVEKGLATGTALNDEGRRFRRNLEHRTDALTAPAWRAVGLDACTALCEAVEPHHDAIVARIDATAGPRWMPAVRVTERPS